MSWSPEVFIGEFRPWPDTVHVVRGKTDETRRYVPESECYKLQDENDRLWDEFCKMDEWHSKELAAAIDENAKLRELASELWVSCPVHDSDCEECKHKGGRRGCELYDHMKELGVEL